MDLSEFSERIVALNDAFAESQAEVERLRAQLWAQNDINNDQRRYNAAQKQTEADLRVQLAEILEAMPLLENFNGDVHEQWGRGDWRCFWSALKDLQAVLAKIRAGGVAGTPTASGSAQPGGVKADSSAEAGASGAPRPPAPACRRMSARPGLIVDHCDCEACSPAKATEGKR